MCLKTPLEVFSSEEAEAMPAESESPFMQDNGSMNENIKFVFYLLQRIMKLTHIGSLIVLRDRKDC